jgi:hypothetical protein
MSRRPAFADRLSPVQHAPVEHAACVLDAAQATSVPAAPRSSISAVLARLFTRTWNRFTSFFQPATRPQGRRGTKRKASRRERFFRPLQIQQFEARLTLDGSPPMANDDGFSVTHDEVLVVSDRWNGVLANDSDMDMEDIPNLTATLLGTAPEGLAFSGDGTFTYTPPAHWSGIVTFDYELSDGDQWPEPITATVTINVMNSAPYGNSDGYSVTHDEVLTITDRWNGVLVNDTDMDVNDYPALTANLLGGPSDGDLAFSSDGTFTYTPPAHWAGTVSFTYEVDDHVTTTGPTGPVTVTINVINNVPYGNSDGYSVTHDHFLTITDRWSGVLANDTDMDVNDYPNLTAELVDDVEEGTLEFRADGTFDYTPPEHWAGIVTFTYQANDQVTLSQVVTVTINVMNSAPYGNSDGYSVTHDHTLDMMSRESGVLANDTDMEMDLLTISDFTFPDHFEEFQLASDGGFLYIPPEHWAGVATFTYFVTDGVVETGPITVTINVTNVAPTASDLPNAYHGVPNTDTVTIGLDGYFADFDDDTADLAYTVILDSGANIVSGAIDAETRVLTLTFSATPGVAQLRIRATDPVGEYADANLTAYNIELSNPTIEREIGDDEWEAVALGEVVWDDDVLRWDVEVTPSSIPGITSVEWVAAHWPVPLYPEASWTSFASASIGQWAYGSPGFGYWLVSPRITLPTGYVFLAEPMKVPVASFEYLKWKQHDFGDGKTSYDDAAEIFYSEKQSSELGAPVHDRIDVEVKLRDWVAAPDEDVNARVYLKMFDPDNAPTDADIDPNGNGPDDNVGLNTPSGFLQPDSLLIPRTTSVKKTSLYVFAPQPGNNFIVAASGTLARLNNVVFAADGVTLLKEPGGGDVEGNRRTSILTLWRTLWIEQDSMAAPDPGEPFGGFGIGYHDEYPGDLGTTGEHGTGDHGGVFGQPSLDFLTAQMARANVRVKVLTPLLEDFVDNAEFVHNLGEFANQSVDSGDLVRDVNSLASFWVIQVLAAYEWKLDRDYDYIIGTEQAELGNTNLGANDGPINIYLETIRTVSIDTPNAVSADAIKQRTVLHESMHQFGYLLHDMGVMVADTVVTGTDAQNALTGSQIRAIIVAERPA